MERAAHPEPQPGFAATISRVYKGAVSAGPSEVLHRAPALSTRHFPVLAAGDSHAGLFTEGSQPRAASVPSSHLPTEQGLPFQHDLALGLPSLLAAGAGLTPRHRAWSQQLMRSVLWAPVGLIPQQQQH